MLSSVIHAGYESGDIVKKIITQVPCSWKRFFSAMVALSEWIINENIFYLYITFIEEQTIPLFIFARIITKYQVVIVLEKHYYHLITLYTSQEYNIIIKYVIFNKIMFQNADKYI